MAIYLRPDRRAIAINGPGAHKLLNDVLTARIEEVEGNARWWALLSAQGKIQAEGLINWQDGTFWLDVHSSALESFLKRMRLLKLRAEVTITDCSESHQVGWTPELAPGATPDPRWQSAGFRIIAEASATPDWLTGTSPIDAARVAAGIAELGPDFDADSLFPHDIAMDVHDAIDFKKGCYIGQEVVSRMQHKATSRRRPVIVAGDNLSSGAPLLAGEREAGTLGTPQDAKAISIARIDRLAADPNWSVLGQPVEVTLPHWATYSIEQPSLAATESD